MFGRYPVVVKYSDACNVKAHSLPLTLSDRLDLAGEVACRNKANLGRSVFSLVPEGSILSFLSNDIEPRAAVMRRLRRKMKKKKQGPTGSVCSADKA